MFYVADIQEFYECTLLDETKDNNQKTAETLQMVMKWEKEPPIITSTLKSEVSQHHHIPFIILLSNTCHKPCLHQPYGRLAIAFDWKCKEFARDRTAVIWIHNTLGSIADLHLEGSIFTHYLIMLHIYVKIFIYFYIIFFNLTIQRQPPWCQS